MITFIRRWLTSWPVIILLGVVLVAFAVTGIGDPLGGGAAPTGSVARVGSRTITENQLVQTFDRLMRSIREQNPAAVQTEIARSGGVAGAADQLIGQIAIEELGLQSGLAVSDRAIGAVIAGVPAFQSGGKFDDATYRRVIAEQRLSDRELRDGIRGDLVRKQLLTPVTAALGVPEGLARPYAQLLVDIHRGAVALVPLTTPAPPSEAEIARYYAANLPRFTLPERRAFRYALIDSAGIASKAVVTEPQIAAAFAKDPGKYGAAATRTLQQVVVPAEATAKAIAAAATTEGFAAAAQRLAGFAAADIALGEQNEAAFGKATSPAVARAAFALPAGGITPPIKTDFGWHVVRVDAIAGTGKTLAAARPAVEAELRARAGTAAVADLVAKIEDGVDAGKSFADLAAETGLTIVAQAPLPKEGALPGAPLPAPDLAALATRAFRHEPGDGAAVEDLAAPGTPGQPQRLAVIETMQILPAAPQPLAQVRGAAIAGATRDKALAAARGKADAVVAAVRKGTDFAAAVAAQGLPPARPLAGRRLDAAQGGQAVPPIVQAFLNTPAGTVQIVPSPEGWVLIHAAAIERGDITRVPGLLDAGRREIASQLPDEFAAGFAAAAERAVDTRRNAAVIAAVTRRLSGQDAGTR